MGRTGRLSALCLRVGGSVSLIGCLSLFVGCAQQTPEFSSSSTGMEEYEAGSSRYEGDANGEASRAQCLTDGVMRSECVSTAAGGDGSAIDPLDGGSPSQAGGSSSVPSAGQGGSTSSESPNNGNSSLPKSPSQPAATPAPAPTQAPRPAMGDWREVGVVEPARGKVDILWAIDSSGSMEWAQRELSTKFENFAKELSAADIDFRLGITSLDMCRPDLVDDAFCPENDRASSAGSRGDLVSIQGVSTKYLTAATPEFIKKFGGAALLGTSGSGLEQGLSAAKFAVQKSASGGANEGFIRSDARLSVIVLSDEEDDGIGMWEEDAWGAKGIKDYFGSPSYPIDPNWKAKFDYSNQHMTAHRFVSDMNSLKGTGKFQISAITGVKNLAGQTYCYKDSAGKPFGPMEAGTNYQKAAKLTGGVVENICGQWASILANLGRSTVELTTRISIPTEPFPGTLEVYVNGTRWVDGFEFDAASKMVVFKSTPPYSANVVVRYREILR